MKNLLSILFLIFVCFPIKNEHEKWLKACPKGHKTASNTINSVFAPESSKKISLKIRFGIEVDSPHNIQLLTDSNDKEICKQLNKRFEYPIPDHPEVKRVYYKSNKYYFSVQFVEPVITEDGAIQMSSGGSVLKVFNEELNSVGAVLL